MPYNFVKKKINIVNDNNRDPIERIRPNRTKTVAGLEQRTWTQFQERARRERQIEKSERCLRTLVVLEEQSALKLTTWITRRPPTICLRLETYQCKARRRC